MERKLDGMKLKLGDEAPYFNLPGTDGKRYSLHDFDNHKALAVLFTCNHCPYVQGWDERLVTLQSRFVDDGFQLVAICSNDQESYPEDSFDNMVKKSKSQDFVFPYLHDENQSVAKAYDAACTPEVYLFDSELKLKYHGRIDDNYKDEKMVSSKDLETAVVSLIEGGEPNNPLTPAIGCSIKWK